jgi:glycosyltransferase involved in cell wall biosynthesis
VENFRPDTVISANTPLLTQRIIQSATLAHGSQFVFWLQDILSVGIGQAMRRRNRIFGGAIGLAFERLENLILNDSNAIVAISEDFIPVLIHRGIPAEKISVIHNWAPLDALPMTSKNNNWSSAHNLADKTVVMYTGTLGLKHNPGLLVALAEALQTREDVRLVIISEGLGADYVAEAMSHSNSGRLQQLPFQPFSQLAEVLGSADILLAILEKDAGQFAVPSKILTYMCSGRAIVAAMPGENLASRIVCEAGAGIVTEPEDDAGFVRAVECLLDDATRRARHAQNARSFAETGFDISSITSRFENLLNQ